MSRRTEIEDAINEIIGDVNEYNDDDVDQAVVENDDELMKNQNAIGIEEDEMWNAVTVDKNTAFNNLSENKQVMMEEDSVSDDENESDNQMEIEDNEYSMEDDDDDDDEEDEDEADKLIAKAMNIKTIEKKKNEAEREDVMNQIKLYDTAMDIRVKLQGITTSVNSLPLPQDLKVLKENNNILETEMEKLNDNFKELFHECASLSETIDKQWKYDWEYDNDDDEESKLEKVNSSKDSKRLQIMEKWHSKTTMMNISKFSTNQNSVVQQVNAIMKDKDRLYRRSRQLRGVKIHLNEDLTCSEEIFDDSDFYQQMIKDAVEYGITGKGSGITNKIQTNIVFPKLENFMSPIEYREDLMEVDRSVLIKNLFN
ncbi:AATF leucine zipper-containing domain-containing protein [Entamoeba marina]